VFEAAAMDLAVQEAGTDALQIEDWHVMFVARGKVGPFRVDGEATQGPLGRIGCRLSLYDEGNADRAVSAASGVFRAAP
jgi:hypothetical protein